MMDSETIVAVKRSASGFPRWIEKMLGSEICVLTRHFLNRYLKSDLAGTDDEASLTTGNILAFLAAPGMMFTLCLAPKYSWHAGQYGSPAYFAASLPDKFLYLTLTIVVIGIFTVLRWDALFPDRFDFMALTPLPIGAGRVFAAKTLSLAVVILVLALDLNLAPSLAYPCVVFGRAPSFLAMARLVSAHLIAMMAAALFIFLLLLAIHGTLLSLLGHRWFQRVSPFVQFAMLFWLGNQFLAIADWRNVMDRLHHSGARIDWLFPTLWFLGLYEKLLGRADPVFQVLANRAVMALGCTAAVACASYIGGYARHLRRSADTRQESGRPSPWLVRQWERAMNRWLVRHPRERAAFHYVWRTVSRSPMHRLFLGAYAGVGTAVVVEALAALLIGAGSRVPRDITVAIYSLPLVLSFLLLTGLRVIFTVPAELCANWTFRLAHHDDHTASLLIGTRKAVLTIGIAPLFLAVGTIFTLRWGLGMATVHVLYGASLAWLLMEALLWDFTRVPFTCAYHPWKVSFPLAVLLFVGAFGVYVYAMASFEYWLLEQPWRMIVYLALVAIALVARSVTWERRPEEGWQLLFDDQPEPEVRTLGIG